MAKGQGLKFDSGKPRMELLDTFALREVALVLSFGAEKYDAHNWRKGMLWSRLLGACLRHVFAFIGGEDKDPETGLSHLAHAICCLMFLLNYTQTYRDGDDRAVVTPADNTLGTLLNLPATTQAEGLKKSAPK